MTADFVPETKLAAVGLVVNPIAGMGGAVGLKGSDGSEVTSRARALGAVPVAPRRAIIALRRLRQVLPHVVIVTFEGDMGGEASRAAGLPTRVVGTAGGAASTADDTRNAVNCLAHSGVDLLLFAGGDGTARDVMDALAPGMIVLGIPAGCKMQSAVFAATPAAAGDLAGQWLAKAPSRRRARDVEVVDIDEDAYRCGMLSSRLYGYTRVPDDLRLLQSAKSSVPSDDSSVESIAAELVAEMDAATVFILGGGTTTRRVFELLGLDKTLLGFDAVQAGLLVGRDLSERGILELLAWGVPAKLVVSVIGAQGYVLGRGSQQVSPAVLRRLGAENVIVLSGPRKLTSVVGGVLRIDTGAADTDSVFGKYVRVRTGAGRTILMPVATF